MQIGDIILVGGSDFGSKVIKRITGTIWSHVALCLGQGLILEINWNTKTHIVHNEYRNLGYDYVVLRSNVPLSKLQKQEIACSALKFNNTGNKYDWLLILGLFLKTKFPNSKLLRLFNRKKFYICTELVDQVLQEAGIQLFPDREGDIYPHEFLSCKQLYVIESNNKMIG